MASIPNKAGFKIGEAARIVGVEAHVLRYWEVEFPGQIRAQRSASNQRVYARRDIERFLEIRALRYTEKLEVAGAKKRLRVAAGEELAPEKARFLTLLGEAVRELLAIIDEDEATL